MNVTIRFDWTGNFRRRQDILARALGVRVLIGIWAVVLTSGAIRGAETETGEADLTIYYIAEVEYESVAEGGIQVLLDDDEIVRFRLAAADLKRANLEGTVATRDADGELVVDNIVRLGFWMRLPKGWQGKGNKSNPIVPYRSVAADQSVYPYGSRVFIPDAVGFETPDGKVLDGVLWVADSGGGIRGRLRFDIFVGFEPNYHRLAELELHRWKSAVEIERLPSPPRGYDYRNAAGRRRILEGLGYDVEGLLEVVVEELRGIDDAGTSAEAALIHFQKQHSQIPELEYGLGDGAVTRWFLAQAAKAVADGEQYPAGPGKAVD